MQSEEQWIEIDRCLDCNSPIFKMGDETKFTGPAECGCWLRKEEKVEIQTMDDLEIPEENIEAVFASYWFVHADYGEGLNYGVGKELINRSLKVIEGVLKEPIEKVDDGLSAEKYLKMLYPLLQKVQTKLKTKGGETK